jgi:hypothetical protein
MTDPESACHFHHFKAIKLICCLSFNVHDSSFEFSLKTLPAAVCDTVKEFRCRYRRKECGERETARSNHIFISQWSIVGGRSRPAGPGAAAAPAHCLSLRPGARLVSHDKCFTADSEDLRCGTPYTLYVVGCRNYYQLEQPDSEDSENHDEPWSASECIIITSRLCSTRQLLRPYQCISESAAASELTRYRIAPYKLERYQ